MNDHDKYTLHQLIVLTRLIHCVDADDYLERFGNIDHSALVQTLEAGEEFTPTVIRGLAEATQAFRARVREIMPASFWKRVDAEIEQAIAEKLVRVTREVLEKLMPRGPDDGAFARPGDVQDAPSDPEAN